MFSCVDGAHLEVWYSLTHIPFQALYIERVFESPESNLQLIFAKEFLVSLSCAFAVIKPSFRHRSV